MAKFRLLENLLKISDFETLRPVDKMGSRIFIGEPIENK